MQYVLVLAAAPDAWATDDPAPAPDDGVYADWETYTRALHEAGVLVGGVGLHEAATATTVRLRGGNRLLTDGPWVESKEELIGFYLLDVPGLDEALDWAARAPHVRIGTVEVRPVRPGSDTVSTLARAGVVEAGSTPADDVPPDRG